LSASAAGDISLVLPASPPHFPRAASAVPASPPTTPRWPPARAVSARWRRGRRAGRSQSGVASKAARAARPTRAAATDRGGGAGEATPLLIEGTLQDVQRKVHTKADQARDATQRESIECGAERGKEAEGEDEAQECGQDAIDQHSPAPQ